MSGGRSAGPLAVFALGALAALAALPSCKKEAGDECKGAESMCADPKTALVCRGGKLAKVACGGPLGCSTYEDHANCDDSTAAMGSACMGTTDAEYACTPDKKTALVCKGGVFARYLECRGKGGCALLGGKISCDTSVANAGDPCKNERAIACSADKKQMVMCAQGAFRLYRHCRGEAGCYMKGDTPSCDETRSLEQDPCGLPGYVVCSVDGKSELVCQGSEFRKSRSCKKGCFVKASGSVDCR